MSQREIYIIAFDPGEITGLAYYAYKQPLLTYELPWLHAVRNLQQFVFEWTHHKEFIIVGERYDQPGKRGSVLTPQTAALKCIGAVEFIATQCNVTFQLQGRSDASKIDDKMLKKLGWYVKTQDGHANAAARQVAYSMLVHHPVEYIELLESS